MATYLPLPPAVVTATADKTGMNTGNWTCAFDASTPSFGNIDMPVFELYHATVAQVPGGASAQILISRQLWGFTAPGVGGGAEYHLGASGALLAPGQEIWFLWTAAATGVPPEVTLWFRYDLDVPANDATVNG